MSMSRREQGMIVAIAAVVLFGIPGITAKKQLAAIRDQRDKLSGLAMNRQRESSLMNTADRWLSRYQEVSGQLPVFPPNVNVVDTYWMKRMDNLAEENGVKLLRRESGREMFVGGVYEFSINCRNWEGTLEAFSKFLFALQSEGAMWDIRGLTMRPHRTPASAGAGMLEGSYTLYCAYMRGTDESAGETR